MQIVVYGAGAWGTALAIHAAHCSGVQNVSLWARDGAQAAAMQAARANARYLKGHAFPASLTVQAGSPEQAAHALGVDDLLIVATPMAGLRGVLIDLAAASCPASVAWLCKGFEQGSQALAHEVARDAAPHLHVGALSGPSFAQEVAAGQPTALVAASAHAPLRDQLVRAFHHHHVRVYGNDDVAGVEVGGAVKNVLAIATGLCDGLQLGLNARAALITRGLAEMTRLGLALGARADTFMGLSGLGDLVLTATGDLSRNRRVGLLLAQGLTLPQAVDSLGHVAEGVYSARTVVDRAAAVGVDMPIARAVVALLDGDCSPAEAVARLMGREPKSESMA